MSPHQRHDDADLTDEEEDAIFDRLAVSMRMREELAAELAALGSTTNMLLKDLKAAHMLPSRTHRPKAKPHSLK